MIVYFDKVDLMWRWRVSSGPTPSFSTFPRRHRPSLLVWRVVVSFYHPFDLSLCLSLSLVLLHSFLSVRSPLKQESEVASALITTRPKSYMEFICHRHALRRDTTRYSSLLNPRTRKRASDGGNILSLFNLTARARVAMLEIYRDDFY